MQTTEKPPVKSTFLLDNWKKFLEDFPYVGDSMEDKMLFCSGFSMGMCDSAEGKLSSEKLKKHSKEFTTGYIFGAVEFAGMRKADASFFTSMKDELSEMYQEYKNSEGHVQ